MVKFDETIRSATHAIYDGCLKEAVRLLRLIYDGHPSLIGFEDLERVSRDYVTMRKFMLKGYEDPEREQLYDRLLHDLYRIIANLVISWRCKNIEAYALAYHTDNHLNRSHDFIKTVLELFVSDETLLSLKDSHEQKQAAESLYNRHQTFMERLFCALFISLQWTDADQSFFENLLISPLISREDALLITSALMLATLNVYDERKWVALTNVYLRASDEQLRQRALIGWVLTSHPQTDFFKKQQTIFNSLLMNANTRSELLELQKQIFFCLNAEKDNATIRKDIIPDMMKGSYLHMGQFGIEDKPDDDLRDILHPNADEEDMEKVEKSIERMREMEKKGSDIYFGGFAKMKSFPFFHVLSNWFAPFNLHHPGLYEAQRKVGDGQLLNTLVSQKTMCASDKFSLVLAMGKVIDHIPANLLEAMKAVKDFDLLSQEETGRVDSPTFVRRMYLQDLYRFFRLWPKRTQIATLFTDQDDRTFFLCMPLFRHEDSATLKLQLGSFLLRHGMYDRLHRLLATMDGVDGGQQFDFLRGCLCLHDGKYKLALDRFQTLMANGHESVTLLRATAKAALRTGNYLMAYNCFNKLKSLEPDNIRLNLNTCLAALKIGKVKETLNRLFELYYKFPDDLNVQRVLAWSLLNSKNPSKALQVYEKLLTTKPEAEDFINAGYAHWLSGDFAGALKTFNLYPDTAHIIEEFEKDKELLLQNGISKTDFTLMADAVDEEQQS